MKRLQLEGQRFGLLTVQDLSEISRNGHSRYNVVCDCGNKKTVLSTHLISGKTSSCGCKLREPRNWKGIGHIPMTYFSSIKRGALGFKGRLAVEFSVTIEYLAELYEQQEGLCRYSKLPIDFKSKTASLDRINSDIGYVEGNVQWVHKDINMMKRHYTESYFIELCKKVAGNSCEIV